MTGAPTSDGTAGAALRSMALRLQAAELPYYLHRPRAETEPAPGWYWRPAGADHPRYLGYNHYAAYAELHRLLSARAA